MTTITWSKGRDGAWLVRGPLGLSGPVTVSKRDGSQSEVVVRTCIWQGAGVALYAIAPRDQAAPRASNYDPQRFNGYGASRGGYRRACKTGGNCSSFGSGRSCGGHDCDGY